MKKGTEVLVMAVEIRRVHGKSALDDPENVCLWRGKNSTFPGTLAAERFTEAFRVD